MFLLHIPAACPAAYPCCMSLRHVQSECPG
jgi:hypothetical protein